MSDPEPSKILKYLKLDLKNNDKSKGSQFNKMETIIVKSEVSNILKDVLKKKHNNFI
jgi:hypothetical protein